MLGAVRVVIVTESFLPRVNGVTNSVCRVLEYLAGRGHEVLVVAPGDGPGGHAGRPVRWTPGAALPFYGVRAGAGARRARLGCRASVTVGS